MSLLLRIVFVIPIGYIIACLSSGATIMAAVYDLGSQSHCPLDGLAFAFALFIAFQVGAFAALPMALAIVLAEAFGWRSLLGWTVYGGALSVPAQFVAEHADVVFAADDPLRFIAAGLVFGAVYWLIAGHGSGSAIAKRPAHP